MSRAVHNYTPVPTPLRSNWGAALIATAYLLLLVVPWILTCVLAFRTAPQTLTATQATDHHRLALAIDVFNIVAALVALPAVYALLARAAAVYSQRQNIRKKLSVKQLFALADRRFLRFGFSPGNKASTTLAALGAALIVLVLAFPFLRAILVHSETKLLPEKPSGAPDRGYGPNEWASHLVGLDPPIYRIQSVDSRLAAEKTRHALINAHPAEWKVRAWHDPHGGKDHPYFASAIPRDTTTGLLRQHALRMNSTVSCDKVPSSDFPTNCLERYSGYELATKYENANLTVTVCQEYPLNTNPNKQPWNDTDQHFQQWRETLWIDLTSPEHPDHRDGRLMYNSITLKCQSTTALGYFELGNSFNNGQFGPLLREFRHNSSWYTPEDKKDNSNGITNLTLPEEYYDMPPDYGMDTYRGSTSVYNGVNASGPLDVATEALFGRDSFFDLAQSITDPNDTLSQTLYRLSPVPFQRSHTSLRRCEPHYPWTNDPGEPGPYASTFGWANDRVAALIHLIAAGPDADGLVDGILGTAMHLAAQATLDAAAIPDSKAFGAEGRPFQIWRAEGLPARTPVMSLPAMIVLSVVVALQVGGMVMLVWYVYRVRTWTETLDALALARVVAQLRDVGLFRADGFWEITRQEDEAMGLVDGLVGVENPEVESEEGKMVYLLGVGGPGLITELLYKPRKGMDLRFAQPSSGVELTNLGETGRQRR